MAACANLFSDTPGSTTAGAISPVFASTQDRTVMAKDISLPAPDAKDVDWLKLGAIENQGTLAKTGFRLFTAGGQPPSTVSRF